VPRLVPDQVGSAKAGPRTAVNGPLAKCLNHLEGRINVVLLGPLEVRRLGGDSRRRCKVACQSLFAGGGAVRLARLMYG